MQPLNPETLATFADFMSPTELQDFLSRVNKEWLASWPTLQAHIQAEDWATVQKLAHRLKGTVGSVGCDGLYAVLNDFENALREEPRRPPSAHELERLKAAATDAEHAFALAISALGDPA